MKPGKSLPGRFPSTHITKCCLSILVGIVRFEPTHPVETDLQSAAPLQLRRIPINSLCQTWCSNWELNPTSHLFLQTGDITSHRHMPLGFAILLRIQSNNLSPDLPRKTRHTNYVLPPPAIVATLMCLDWCRAWDSNPERLT